MELFPKQAEKHGGKLALNKHTSTPSPMVTTADLQINCSYRIYILPFGMSSGMRLGNLGPSPRRLWNLLLWMYVSLTLPLGRSPQNPFVRFRDHEFSSFLVKTVVLQSVVVPDPRLGFVVGVFFCSFCFFSDKLLTSWQQGETNQENYNINDDIQIVPVPVVVALAVAVAEAVAVAVVVIIVIVVAVPVPVPQQWQKQ